MGRIDLLVAACNLAWIDSTFRYCRASFCPVVSRNGLVEPKATETRSLDGRSICPWNGGFVGDSRTFPRLGIYGVSLVALVGQPMESADYASKRSVLWSMGNFVLLGFAE